VGKIYFSPESSLICDICTVFTVDTILLRLEGF